ncbi:MAG TPA: hypothetical protein VF423_14895 [Actinomycetes bacterium]
MLTWVSLAAALGALLVAARWATGRVDGLGRVRAFPLVSVLLLSSVAVGAAVPVVRAQRLESTLSDAASVLVGAEVTVDCQSRGQEFLDVGAELGWVRYDRAGVPEPRALIKRAPCAALAGYLRSDRSSPSRDQVVAVHVLSHEAQHMAGLTAEAEAECGAVQRDALAARLLGADPAQARALAEAYWREVYPRMPDEYRTPDCAPGGRLDERLPDAPWASASG